MSLLRRAALAAVSATALFAAGAAALAPPPKTETKPVTDSYFGTSVIDSYRWLENVDDPQVKAWNEAQNGYARSFLDALPGRDTLKTRLTAMIKATSPAFRELHAAGEHIFAIYADPQFQQPMLVTLPLSADPGAKQVLLDPNKMDAKGLTAIDWFKPSHDGKYIAVSISKNGSEDGTLHIFDVATGKEVGDGIPGVQYPTAGGSMAWAADGKGFWYTRYPGDDAPEAERHFSMQVYFHVIGTDWKSDKLILGTADGVEKIGEINLMNDYAPDVVLASIQKGDGGEWQNWLIEADGTKHKIGAYADKLVAMTVAPDHSLIIVTRKDAPKGKIIKLAPGAFDVSKATTIVPEKNASIIIQAVDAPLPPTLTKAGMLVSYIDGGPEKIEAYGLDGTSKGELPIKDLVALDDIGALPNGDAMFRVAGYLRPPYYARWKADTNTVVETALAVTSPIKFDDAEVVRAFATSKDGTKVPISILRKKGTVLDGSHPVLVYGYGGYGVSQEPHFEGAQGRLWLDAGGVDVEANIRGGGEYGESWHDEGRLLKKQNVFDDFAAAAQFMVDQKYTDHQHLALLGGSNGGLLMGAQITQHPELAKAVVSAVGIYDMLRVELDPNGSFNTTEFGTVKDEAQFKALYAYSPYHHVKPGTAYPAVLMLTGANDGRVNPMQSRKFAAALQAATTSGNPILLRISTTSGHGIGSSLDEQIAQRTDMLSFLFNELGMTLKAE